MSILDVTEDQIFHTLGRGRDPNFKPIEKERPIIPKAKKTYTVNKTIKPSHQEIAPQVMHVTAEQVKPAPVVDESVVKLTAELNELNNRVTGIQKMVKWYIIPQFVVVFVMLVALLIKS